MWQHTCALDNLSQKNTQNNQHPLSVFVRQECSLRKTNWMENSNPNYNTNVDGGRRTKRGDGGRVLSEMNNNLIYARILDPQKNTIVISVYTTAY